jgi:hypothetical protein
VTLKAQYDTPLNDFMVANRITEYAMAKAVGCSVRAVRYWRFNQALPSIVYAKRMEDVTGGAVPMTSWLATPLGEAQLAVSVTNFGREKKRKKELLLRKSREAKALKDDTRVTVGSGNIFHDLNLKDPDEVS